MTSYRRRSSGMRQLREKKKPCAKERKPQSPILEKAMILPLFDKRIYMDVKHGKHAELMEEQLRKLGARIEKFLSRDVNYVISTCAPTRVEDVVNTCEDNPQSPSQASVPSPFSWVPSPTGLTEPKKTVVSRGKALAQIACAKSKASTTVASAEKLGIKIVSFDTATRWLDRELKKIETECSRGKDSQEIKSKAKKKREKRKIKVLKGSFIKFEAHNLQYRPVKCQLPQWPRLNISAPPGLCPFGEAKLKVQHQFGFRKLPAADGAGTTVMTSQCGKLACPNEGENVAPQATHTAGELLGVPIVTAGDVKRNLENQVKRRPSKQSGFCDCCKVKFLDINQHVTGDEHRAFARDKSNYESLDMVIGQIPSTIGFLQSVLLRHCVKKQFEPSLDNSQDQSKKNIFDLPAPPVSPLTTEKTGHISQEDVVLGLHTPQPDETEVTPSPDQFTATDADLIVNAAMNSVDRQRDGADDRPSAVVIRKPVASGLFTSPRRRQPTPSKKPWSQERSLVFRDSPMASLQPSPCNSSTVLEDIALLSQGNSPLPSHEGRNTKQTETKSSVSRSLTNFMESAEKKVGKKDEESCDIFLGEHYVATHSNVNKGMGDCPSVVKCEDMSLGKTSILQVSMDEINSKERKTMDLQNMAKDVPTSYDTEALELDGVHGSLKEDIDDHLGDGNNNHDADKSVPVNMVIQGADQVVARTSLDVCEEMYVKKKDHDMSVVDKVVPSIADRVKRRSRSDCVEKGSNADKCGVAREFSIKGPGCTITSVIDKPDINFHGYEKAELMGKQMHTAVSFGEIVTHVEVEDKCGSVRKVCSENDGHEHKTRKKVGQEKIKEVCPLKQVARNNFVDNLNLLDRLSKDLQDHTEHIETANLTELLTPGKPPLVRSKIELGQDADRDNKERSEQACVLASGITALPSCNDGGEYDQTSEPSTSISVKHEKNGSHADMMKVQTKAGELLPEMYTYPKATVALGESDGSVTVCPSENIAASVIRMQRTCKHFVHKGLYANSGEGDDLQACLALTENEGLLVVPNIADRVKCRSRKHLPKSSSHDGDAEESNVESNMNVMPTNKVVRTKSRRQRSLRKYRKECKKTETFDSGDASSMGKASGEMLVDKEDLSKPVVPNIAESVKKRRSCTLFNHEGQYAYDGEDCVSLNSERAEIECFKVNNSASILVSGQEKIVKEQNPSSSYEKVTKKDPLSSKNGYPALVIRRWKLACPVYSGKRGEADWSKLHSRKDWAIEQEAELQWNGESKSHQPAGQRQETDLQRNDVPQSQLQQLNYQHTNDNSLCGGISGTEQKVPSRKLKRLVKSSSCLLPKDDELVAGGPVLPPVVSGSPRLRLRLRRNSNNAGFSSTLEEIYDDPLERKSVSEIENSSHNRVKKCTIGDHEGSIENAANTVKTSLESTVTPLSSAARCYTDNESVDLLPSPVCHRREKRKRKKHSSLRKSKRRHSQLNADSMLVCDSPCKASIDHKQHIIPSPPRKKGRLELKLVDLKYSKDYKYKVIGSAAIETLHLTPHKKQEVQTLKYRPTSPCFSSPVISTQERSGFMRANSPNKAQKKTVSNAYSPVFKAVLGRRKSLQYLTEIDKRPDTNTETRNPETHCFAKGNLEGGKRPQAWPGTNSSSFTTKVKSSDSWRLVSDHSMVRLLESEPDSTPFQGFHGSSNYGLPSDLSYENASDEELNVSENKEWLVDQKQDSLADVCNSTNTQNAVNDVEDLLAFVPTFSSPGKPGNDSSWGEVCETYLSTSIHTRNQQPYCQTEAGIDVGKSLSVRSPFSSPNKKGKGGPNAQKLLLKSISTLQSTPKKEASPLSKNGLSYGAEMGHIQTTNAAECTPVKKVSTDGQESPSAIERVDEVVSFNYRSPQRILFWPNNSHRLRSPLKRPDFDSGVGAVDRSARSPKQKHCKKS